MSWSERLLLHVLTTAMELSWLGAWATFATIGTMGRPFPLVEATATFVGAFALTRLSSGRGWRVIRVAAAQTAGLLGATAGILHSHYVPARPLFDRAWLLDFLGATRSAVDWLLLMLILAWAIVFWIGGVRLAVRPLSYTMVCSRFDLGLTAFVLLFLVKLLITGKGGQVDDRISPIFLPPCFVASLLAIGTIRLRSDGRKGFLSGYRGLGIFLTFTAGTLLVAATLTLFSLPYLTLAAELGLVALKGAGVVASPFLLWILRRLFAPQTLRSDPARPAAGHDLPTISPPGPEGWWMALVEKALVWAAGFLLVLAVAAAAGLCLYLLARFLWSRTPDQTGHRQHTPVLAWLRQVRMFLVGLRARLAGLRGARDGYRALLAWARRSGLRPATTHTPAEIGARLQGCFPQLRAEIGSIVAAFNEEVYRETMLPAERLAEVRSAWRRLRSPRQWPARFKILWRGE